MAKAFPVPNPVSRGKLWFGFCGGGVAWTFHLIAAYVIAEFGCLGGWQTVLFAGVTAVSWSLLAVSALAMAAAAAATWVSWKARDQLVAGEAPPEQPGSEIYMARAGLFASGSFLFVIVVQTIPIFFFLGDC
jgi:hypothetical protein